MKFLRRKDQSNYVADQDISITLGSEGGTDTDTVENIPINPDVALEVEIEGKRYVLLAYEPKE